MPPSTHNKCFTTFTLGQTGQLLQRPFLGTLSFSRSSMKDCMKELMIAEVISGQVLQPTPHLARPLAISAGDNVQVVYQQQRDGCADFCRAPWPWMDMKSPPKPHPAAHGGACTWHW